MKNGTVRRGATKKVIAAAKSMPGGVIRWSEAEGIYRENADGLWSYIPHAVTRIFRSYFTKVEGVRGFYMLNDMIEADPTEHDSLEV